MHHRHSPGSTGYERNRARIIHGSRIIDVTAGHYALIDYRLRSAGIDDDFARFNPAAFDKSRLPDSRGSYICLPLCIRWVSGSGIRHGDGVGFIQQDSLHGLSEKKRAPNNDRVQAKQVSWLIIQQYEPSERVTRIEHG